MGIIGYETDSDTLVLWKGRDFRWNFDNYDEDGALQDYPAGELFFEIHAGGVAPLKWPLSITGSRAILKVESVDADAVPARSLWQLVFLPEGELAGGDPIAHGAVMRVGG